MIIYNCIYVISYMSILYDHYFSRILLTNIFFGTCASPNRSEEQKAARQSNSQDLTQQTSNRLVLVLLALLQPARCGKKSAESRKTNLSPNDIESEWKIMEVNVCRDDSHESLAYIGGLVIRHPVQLSDASTIIKQI